MTNFVKVLSLLLFGGIISSCNTTDKDEAFLVFKYTFDENGERLDNFGDPASIPAGNAAQTPNFNALGIHSIELIDYVLSFPSSSTVIYKGAERTENGEVGIDFDQEKIVADGEILVKIPISSIQPGSYSYLRNSLGYQNYTIDFVYNHSSGSLELEAEVASFVGFKTYISNFNVGAANVVVDDIVSQGYWAFNIDNPIAITQSGQAPSTTVPNPLDAVSPIPLGSCLVTGQFETPLVITGEETEDVVVEVAISINESFEWEDTNADGKYEPAVETVVDMGTRGLKARIQ